MTDLVAWLREQLDEDERVARAARKRQGDGTWPFVADIEESWPEIEAYITYHDPARVLAEVAAKQAIIDQHEAVGGGWRIGDCYCCEIPTPCPTVRLLAQPYADRPGWREEWRT